jgi:hypothetical protein
MTSALLIRLGGLGDLLVALPALRLVRASFPDASLHLLARKEYGGLLLEAGVVNAVSSADDLKWMPLFEASRLTRGGGPGEAPVPAHAGGHVPAYAGDTRNSGGSSHATIGSRAGSTDASPRVSRDG